MPSVIKSNNYPELEGIAMATEMIALFGNQIHIFSQKQQSYADPDDCFENFRLAGKLSKQSPECALYGMVLKHAVAWERAYLLLANEEKLYPPEFYLDKLGDILVYADFWRCMAHARLDQKAYEPDELPKVKRADQALSAASRYKSITEWMGQEWGISRDFWPTVKAQYAELSDAFDQCRYHIFQDKPDISNSRQLVIEAERCQQSSAILYAAMILAWNANNGQGSAYR